ncbi:hypothetical protein MMMDOFMJ_2606 [Methylobacterium gnaphalii]|nr:hypothetical protein MMMDOFMJ_2606 [Methylobacterium gnaphalii]
MRDRKTLAEGREQERVLERGHRAGAGADEPMARGDTSHQLGRILEAAAEEHAEHAITGHLGQCCEPSQDRLGSAPSHAETSGQRAMGRGELQRVLVTEQVEHIGPQPGAPGRLGQRPPGLGGDQNRIAHGTRTSQPATSTASL